MGSGAFQAEEELEQGCEDRNYGAGGRRASVQPVQGVCRVGSIDVEWEVPR